MENLWNSILADFAHFTMSSFFATFMILFVSIDIIGAIPIALYDMTGQLLLQTQSDADGLCEIPLASLTEGLYIVATPVEAVKCVIP